MLDANNEMIVPKEKIPNFVLGISGKANAGKDTFLNLVDTAYNQIVIEGDHDCVDHFVPKIERELFAGAIKKSYSGMFDIPIELLNDAVFKEKHNPFTGTTHRKELQLLGTEFFRERTGNPDIWVQLLKSRILKLNNSIDINYLDSNGYTFNPTNKSIISVTDVRFDNEAQFILDHGMLVNVVRKDSGNIDNPTHKSEIGYPQTPSLVIENNGTMQDLRKKAYLFVVESLIPAVSIHYNIDI